MVSVSGLDILVKNVLHRKVIFLVVYSLYSVPFWDLLPFLKFFCGVMALCSSFPELDYIYQM